MTQIRNSEHRQKIELRHIKLGAAILFTIIVLVVEMGNNYSNLQAMFDLFSPSPTVGMLTAGAFVGLLFAGLVAKSLPFSRGVRWMLWLGIGFLFFFQSATNISVGYTGLVERHDQADRMLVLIRLVLGQSIMAGQGDQLQSGYLIAALMEGLALPVVSLIFFGLAGSLFSQALSEFGLLHENEPGKQEDKTTMQVTQEPGNQANQKAESGSDQAMSKDTRQEVGKDFIDRPGNELTEDKIKELFAGLLVEGTQEEDTATDPGSNKVAIKGKLDQGPQATSDQATNEDAVDKRQIEEPGRQDKAINPGKEYDEQAGMLIDMNQPGRGTRQPRLKLVELEPGKQEDKATRQMNQAELDELVRQAMAAGKIGDKTIAEFINYQAGEKIVSHNFVNQAKKRIEQAGKELVISGNR